MTPTGDKQGFAEKLKIKRNSMIAFKSAIKNQQSEIALCL